MRERHRPASLQTHVRHFEAGGLHLFDQLRAPIETAMISPDSGPRLAFEMPEPQSFAHLVQRIPEKRIVPIGHAEGRDTARPQHSKKLG